jgi:hypothetical protein
MVATRRVAKTLRIPQDRSEVDVRAVRRAVRLGAGRFSLEEAP